MSSSSEYQKPILIPTDPVVIRSFIMYHVLDKKSVSEGYKDLCKIIPEFDYPEYDFWYYRFRAGNLDVNYDRSVDPKPLTLKELPVDALRKIFEKLDEEERFKIRMVSKAMKSVVDQRRMVYKWLSISCEQTSVSFHVNVGDLPWELQYFKKKDGCKVQRNNRSEEIVGRDFMEIALDDLGSILRPTEIRLEQFEICAERFFFVEEGLKRIRQIVDLLISISKKANSEFYVKWIDIGFHYSSLALPVLSLMKPRVLEKLEIIIFNCSRKFTEKLIDMNQIKDMEQFKRAKKVDLTGFGFIQSTDLSLFFGFKTFNVHVTSMEPEDVIRLRDDLSKPDNTIFKRCSIQLKIPFTNIEFFEIARVFGKDAPDKCIRVESSIANSEKVLEFVIKKDEIDIKKTDPTKISDNSDSNDSDSDD